MASPLRNIVSRALAFSLLASPAARALVVDDTTTQNLSAPANGAPWYNLGTGGGASGVYLKKGWVISARHVFGEGSSPLINFGGVLYNGGQIYVLTNPDATASDVVLFNIGETAPVQTSEIDVTTSLLRTSYSLTMIGYGAKRSGPLVSISYTSGSTNGYAWDGSGGSTKSWGTNTRSSSVSTITAPGNNGFRAYRTTFSATGASGSAQAATGDSGGAVFAKPGNAWLLAGTMHAIAGYDGQPGGTAASGNATYIASLADYATQINQRLNSTTLPPKLNTIYPSSLYTSNTAQTLTLSGTNFASGARVQVASSNNVYSFLDTAIAATYVSANTITVPIQAVSPDTWKVRVLNPDGQPSLSVSIYILAAASFSNWSGAYSLAGSDAMAASDPDGDGVNNLQEYAFGSDPTLSTEAHAPISATENIQGQENFTLTYQRDRSKTDLTYQPQTTPSLTDPWTNLSDSVVPEADPDGAGPLEIHKAAVPVSGAVRFLRIQIVQKAAN